MIGDDDTIVVVKLYRNGYKFYRCSFDDGNGFFEAKKLIVDKFGDDIETITYVNTDNLQDINVLEPPAEEAVAESPLEGAFEDLKVSFANVLDKVDLRWKNDHGAYDELVKSGRGFVNDLSRRIKNLRQ